MTFSSKAIVAGAVMILLGIGVLSFRSTVRDEDDRWWVTHTHFVLERLQSVLIDISQAEAGQQGYILTGEEKYLEPYQVGLGQVHRDIDEVRKLTVDNPRQQTAIDALTPVVDARITLLAVRLEARRRTGLMAVSEAMKKGNGEELMSEIRWRIGEMRHTEMMLLNNRLETAAAGAKSMKAIIVLGNVIAVLILLLAGFVIQREASRRNLAEQQLKGVNEHLERRTVELSETNNELESFSYSVAHDLRAPLRQIAGYSSVLLEDYGPHLDAEARRYVEKVAEGARKMGRLVDDLLSLSRIGRQEISLEATSLDAMLRQVVADLDVECTGRKIEWQIGELFDVRCDSRLMKQVFVNLLSNAVKYTGKREHAVIQVGHMKQNDEHVVFIRDNGVGFEMQYVGKLFGVFQRLHKTKDFEGTGVGLAIVQRIIRKHGGRVWAEARLDQGATFFFTLGSPGIKPATQPEPAIKEEAMHV